MIVSGKKYGVIDVGSNSVRALVYSDGKILYKGLITSRLGEGLAFSGKLSSSAMIRTVGAIRALKEECEKSGATDYLVFATEAVRSATNRDEFINLVKDLGLEIEVVSGDEEGELGLIGALCGNDGGIIDIGGASTEITAAKDGKIIYSHSLPLGAVRLTDMCGEDEKLLYKSVNDRISEYGILPKGVDYGFIGGTATAVCMVAKGLKIYSEEKIDGAVLYYDDVKRAYETVKRHTVEERASVLGLTEKRAEIIVAGAFMIKSLFERFDFEKVTVRLNDNMMGYLKKRIFGKGYDKL